MHVVVHVTKGTVTRPVDLGGFSMAKTGHTWALTKPKHWRSVTRRSHQRHDEDKREQDRRDRCARLPASRIPCWPDVGGARVFAFGLLLIEDDLRADRQPVKAAMSDAA